MVLTEVFSRLVPYVLQRAQAFPGGTFSARIPRPRHPDARDERLIDPPHHPGPRPDGGVLISQSNPHKKRSTSHLVNLLISLSRRILGEAQLFVIQSCLSCCQTCDRHTEWGAGYVVKAYFVAELYRRRISAVLAADTALKVRTCLTSFLNCHLY